MISDFQYNINKEMVFNVLLANIAFYIQTGVFLVVYKMCKCAMTILYCFSNNLELTATNVITLPKFRGAVIFNNIFLKSYLMKDLSSKYIIHFLNWLKYDSYHFYLSVYSLLKTNLTNRFHTTMKRDKNII